MERLSEENPLPKISQNGNKSVTVDTYRVIILLDQKNHLLSSDSSSRDFDCLTVEQYVKDEQSEMLGCFDPCSTMAYRRILRSKLISYHVNALLLHNMHLRVEVLTLTLLQHI